MNWFKKRKTDTTTAQEVPTSESLNGHLYDIETGDGMKSYHSFVGNNLIFKHGLKSCVITGEMKKSQDGSLEQDFIANAKFKDTIFQFIDTVMRQDPNLTRAAENQVEGNVYIIDQRTPDPTGQTPTADIFGAFKVENKVLGVFQSNSNYQIKGENGFMDFGPKNNSRFNRYLEGLLMTETAN